MISLGKVPVLRLQYHYPPLVRVAVYARAALLLQSRLQLRGLIGLLLLRVDLLLESRDLLLEPHDLTVLRGDLLL